jgi:hypothetical protein
MQVGGGGGGGEGGEAKAKRLAQKCAARECGFGEVEFFPMWLYGLGHYSYIIPDMNLALIAAGCIRKCPLDAIAALARKVTEPSSQKSRVNILQSNLSWLSLIRFPSTPISTGLKSQTRSTRWTRLISNSNPDQILRQPVTLTSQNTKVRRDR